MSFDSIRQSFERIVGTKVSEDLIKSGLVKILPSSYDNGLNTAFYYRPVSLVGKTDKDCDEFLSENEIQFFQFKHKKSSIFDSKIDFTKPSNIFESHIIHSALMQAYSASKMDWYSPDEVQPSGLIRKEFYLLDPKVVQKEIDAIRSLPNSRFLGFMSTTDFILLTLKSGKKINWEIDLYQSPRTIVNDFNDSRWKIRSRFEPCSFGPVFRYRYEINIKIK